VNERTARWLAPATAVLSAGVVLVVLLGPLVFGTIDHGVSESLGHRLQGSDAVALVITAPLLILAAGLIRGRRCTGPLLSLGAALATWYSVAGLVLGSDRSLRAGNAEAFFPLFLGILLLATAVAVGSWRALPGGFVDLGEAGGKWVGPVFLGVVAFLVVSRYVPDWVAVVRGTPSTGYLQGPEHWWTVTVQDLALLLPAVATAGAGLVRGARWAAMAAFATAGWLGLIGAAASGMAWSAAAHGDPGASAGSAWAMTGIGALTALPAVLCWATLLRTERRYRSLTQDDRVDHLSEDEALRPARSSSISTPAPPTGRRPVDDTVDLLDAPRS